MLINCCYKNVSFTFLKLTFIRFLAAGMDGGDWSSRPPRENGRRWTNWWYRWGRRDR